MLKPYNGEILFKTHVLFEWEQIQNATSYQIQICNENEFNDCFTDLTITSLVYIEKLNIDWDSNYYWRVRPVFSNLDFGNWLANYSFQTGNKLGTAYSNEYNNANQKYLNAILHDDVQEYGNLRKHYLKQKNLFAINCSISGAITLGIWIWNTFDVNNSIPNNIMMNNKVNIGVNQNGQLEANFAL